MAAEQSHDIPEPHHVTFYTDSQFVINTILKIEDGSIQACPHKRDHWDLIEHLTQVWQTHRFHACKIKSHRKLTDAQSYADALNIQGNNFADEAAVRTCAIDLPEFTVLCTQVRQHYQTQSETLKLVYQFLLDLSCARMTKLEEQHIINKEERTKSLREQAPDAIQGRNTPYLQEQVMLLRDWPCPCPVFAMPEEPHRVVARLVRTFLSNVAMAHA